NGHDHGELAETFARFRVGDDRPKILVADTIKGKGVSFMEHPTALAEGGGTYRWHAGAPGDEDFARAHAELLGRIEESLGQLGLAPLHVEVITSVDDAPARILHGEPESGAGTPAARPKLSDEYVADAYGDALLELADAHPELVVLDGDLASDCRVRAFELAH